MSFHINAKGCFVVAAAALATVCIFTFAKAADMPLKAPPNYRLRDPAPPSNIFSNYVVNGSGLYFGVNAMGAGGAVAGSPAIGATAIQGELGFTLGYSWAMSPNAFAFVEGMFDYANLNGDAAGLALSGPAHFEQRLGFGSPISSLLAAFPTLSFNVPTLPLLPAGVTAGPANPYLYVGLNEQDVSASFGFASNREWEFSPEIGAGMQYKLSDNVVADVWAGWQMRSNGTCLPVACPALGNMARVGFALNY